MNSSIAEVKFAACEQKATKRKRFRTAEDARNAAIELGYSFVCFDYSWYRWIPCENTDDPTHDRRFYEVEMSAEDMESYQYEFIERKRPR